MSAAAAVAAARDETEAEGGAHAAHTYHIHTHVHREIDIAEIASQTLFEHFLQSTLALLIIPMHS